MNQDVIDLMKRSKKALDTARLLLSEDPDAAASRAYYSAFYAVSSYFASCGKVFNKHSGVESAVHRDLVKAGLVSRDLGAAYTSLVGLRTTGDYGGGSHVEQADAESACETAREILDRVEALIGSHQ